MWQDSNIFKPRGGYGSIEERMNKAYAEEDRKEQIQQNLNQYLPMMAKLLEIRKSHQTPIILNNTVSYVTCVLEEDERHGVYKDSREYLRPGTELIYKGYDQQLDTFIFKMQDEDLEIAKSDLKNILINSDIYDVVDKLVKGDI